MVKKIEEFDNKIILGDCLKVMAEIPSNSVDVTFADPPFNLKKSYENYEDNKEYKDYLKWCYKWLSEMVRVTKPTGSIFVHNIPRWLTYFSSHLNKIAKFRHWIAWDAMGAPLGRTLLPNHYGILWYTKSRKFKFYDIRAPHKTCRICENFLKDYGGKKGQIHPFGTLVSDVWTDLHRIRHTKRRDEHPCQLPVPLLERLILMTTDRGDRVLDPFVGTGTTAIACKGLRIKYIGIDIDKKYVEITEKKLMDIKENRLNGVYASIYLGKLKTIRGRDFNRVKGQLHSRNFQIKKGKMGSYSLPKIKIPPP